MLINLERIYMGWFLKNETNVFASDSMTPSHAITRNSGVNNVTLIMNCVTTNSLYILIFV